MVRVQIGPACQFVTTSHLWISVNIPELLIDIFPTLGPMKGGTLIHLVLPEPKVSIDFSKGICSFGNHSTSIAIIKNMPVCGSTPDVLTPQRKTLVAALSNSRMRLRAKTGFLFYEDPNIYSIYPSIVKSHGGQIVSVYGTGFRQGGISCGFGSGFSIAAGRWQSSSLVLCFTIPSNQTTTRSLEISLNGGYDFTDSGAEILYEDGAVLTGVSPSRAMSDTPNQVVTISGDSFKQGCRHVCHFGTSAETRAVYLTSSSLVCSVPRSKPSTVLLTVAQDGLKSEEGVWFVYEHYHSADLSPSTGSSLGGTEVTVRSNTLQDTYTEGGCWFGSAYVPGRIVARNSLVCVSPQYLGNDKVVGVKVMLHRAEGGDVYLDTSFAYRVPALTDRVTPTVGSKNGGTSVLVVGSNLEPSHRCLFGGVEAARSQLISSSALECFTPASSFVGRVVVQVSLDGSIEMSAMKLSFTYAPDATVHFANMGSMVYQSVVVLTGEHFQDSNSLTCKFGGSKSVLGLYQTSTLVQCSVPMLDTGTYAVGISNNGVDRGVGAAVVQYRNAIQIFDVTPSQGSLSGGGQITVHGSGFPTQDGPALCWVDQVSSVAIAQHSSHVVCILQGRQEAGVVDVYLQWGRVAGRSTHVLFEYINPAEIVGIMPSVGSLKPRSGSRVTVIGSGFDAGVGLRCRFGNANCTRSAVKWVTSSLIQCLVPEQSVPGPVEVKVSNDGGREYSTNGPAFLYEDPPSVHGIFPKVIRPGVSHQSTISVIGKLFKNVPNYVACLYGSNSIIQGDYISSTLIVCQTPRNVSGTVAVAVRTGWHGFVSGPGCFVSVLGAQSFMIQPTSGPLSGGTLVTITGIHSGMYDTTEEICCFFGHNGTKVTLLSTSAVLCTVPASFRYGVVTVSVLTTCRASGTLVGTRPFLYLPAVHVVDIYPRRGSQHGRSSIRIIGIGFLGDRARCKLGNLSSPEDGTRIVSSTLIECIAPISEAIGQTLVRVSLDGGQTFSSDEVVFTYEADPTVLSLQPSTAYSKMSNQVVTVHGRHFTDAGDLLCWFGAGHVVRALYVSSVRVLCSIPEQKPGMVRVTVTKDGHNNAPIDALASAYLLYLYYNKGMNSRFTIWPTSGPSLGGSVVRLVGIQDSLKISTCLFDYQTVNVAVYNHSIACVSPAHGETGSVKIQLVPSSLSSLSGVVDFDQAVTFFYYDDPVVDSAFWVGQSGGGTAFVSVLGRHLMANHSMCRLTFESGDSKVLPGTSQTSTKILCVSPPLPQSVGRTWVSISLNDGVDFTSSNTLVSTSSKIDVKSVWPSTGGTDGDMVITIFGAMFYPRQHRLDCWFGFRVSTPALYSSSTLVKCAVPKLLPGTVAVYLGDEQGIHGNSNGQYTVVSRGHVHAVEPSSGPVTGGTAVVMSVRGGAGFASAIFCRIGEGQVVQAQALSSSRILCTMPAVQKSGTVLIRAVEGAQGSSRGLEGEVRYVYYNEPVVTRVEPSSGALEGGTMLSLYGRGLEEGSNLTCRFGTGDAVAGRQETSTMATCVAPPRPVKDVVWLQVSLNGGADFSGSAVEYAYEAGATVDEVRPSAGDSGVDGQTVTVIGRHFGSGQGLSCLFGTRGRVRGMPMTSTAVVCVAPRGGPGAVGVSVSNNGVDEGQTRGGFVYSGDLKVIRKVTPSSGPLAGGTNVTIAVDGLRRAALSWTTERPWGCVFGTSVVQAQALTTSLISCKSPTSLRAGETKIEIELSNHGPTLSIESAFVYYEGPEVSSVVPSIGRQTGGMVVSVVGQGLISRDPVCQFGPSIVQGKDVTSLSSSLLLCTTPASLLGSTVVRLQVSLNGGADFSGSAVEYAYEAGATVDEVRPSAGDSGVDGQTVTVIGRHFGSGQGLSCLFGTRGRVRGMPMTSTAVVCVAPRGGPGAVGVSVSNNGVEGETASGIVSVRYEYRSGMSAKSVVPSQGPSVGGTVVRVMLEGTIGGEDGTGEWLCVFGDSMSRGQLNVSSPDNASVACNLPPSMPSTVSVQVRRPSGQKLSGDLRFQYVLQARLISVSPSQGGAGGGSRVTITGEGIGREGLRCWFGDKAVEGRGVEWISSSLVTCMTPELNIYDGVVSIGLERIFFVSEENELVSTYLHAFDML
ncbi:hypothetical protein GUITHDRAFT_112034 [Guillardia theta CCMP2712]|uniref:IPT/TIG domain-containing protein n=1 Tax=Guillardia theta (strain CCMP2712) TaxID=905079 RepID=L1J179_GUITC|nr:hypothetical protein GUITHDRAFT_112034 [Guillardia theta CCMP2712]EKX41894.1 hypothetical protein GUITHDRAFT_112034 [Guillardia theta CCMP2712]|eukprot:XP_005828874.1 hypothetical protein GUITHDRAFT_112034 [Guillardia theta CCMP2712]